MNASRMQHMVSSGVVLIVAALVTWISFTQKPAEAFLFPRLIAIFFITLALWNFIRAVMSYSKVGEGLDGRSFMNILPGLVVMIAFMFLVAKALGFYFASAIAFLTIFTLYDPVPMTDGKAWMKRAGITLAFMAVMYGLFALLLKVQTPRGIWF